MKNGSLKHLDWHQRRVDESIREHFRCEPGVDLSVLKDRIAGYEKGVYKCRVSYNANEFVHSVSEYHRRKVETLALVRCDELEYGLKWNDRSALDALMEQRGDCDDILIVKGDSVTDSSFSNIVFKDGRRWVTPSDCLLKGTHRARLLDKGVIEEANVSVEDLKGFQGFKLINAMLGFKKKAWIDIRNICFETLG